MTDPSTLSREARIYRALWLKASKSEEPIPVTFSTTGECIAFRMAMYRFIQKYRNDPGLDPELNSAADLVAISTPKPGAAVIYLKPKRSLDLAELAMEALGLGEDDLLTDGEKSMLQVAREAGTKVSPASNFPLPDPEPIRPPTDIDARPANPFFQRD